MMTHRLPIMAFVLASTLALGACGGRSALPPATSSAASGPGAVAQDYLIGPGDELNIFVYRAPELSASLPVRPDGRLSLPLVSDIEAAGRTPSQLATDIQGRLKAYLLDPNVTVMVRSFVGPANRQIRVIGEAAQPISMPYREGMTVLDVMIGARGLTRYAAGNRAEIIRRQRDDASSAEAGPEVIRVRLSDLLRDGDVSQDVPMRPGDTLVIPQGWF